MKPLEPEFKQLREELPKYPSLQLVDVLFDSEQLMAITGRVMKDMIVRGQSASEVGSRCAEIHEQIRIMALEEAARRWMQLATQVTTEFDID